MKQHITIEQLNELSDKEIRKLADYYELEEDITSIEYLRKSQGKYDTTHLLLNIGQMIEFLDENYDWSVSLESMFAEHVFCDALWSAVKEVLKK